MTNLVDSVLPAPDSPLIKTVCDFEVSRSLEGNQDRLRFGGVAEPGIEFSARISADLRP